MSNSHQTSHTGSDGSAEGPQSGTSSPAMPSSGESSAYQFIELPFFAALHSSLAVAGQLSPGDMAAIREAGFSSVINNRPDGEGGPSQRLSTGDLIADDNGRRPSFSRTS
ncbi:MAG: hypothetical protein RLZZ613_1880 [Pseudomonadota bacterium]